MARAARRRGAEAPGARRLTRAGVVLAAAVLGACASQGDPPGGPPDFTAPVLVGLTPDSGATLSDLDRRVRFAFDEVIAERGLRELVTVSPRHERVDVQWERQAVTVRPDGGWRPGVVYTVRLAPGLVDLRNNRLTAEATTVFSTGGGFPATAIRGTMVNWETGRRAVGGLIEAIRPSDSLTYTTETDSSGAFALAWLTPGDWLLVATADQDRNRQRGRREAFDSTLITLGPTDTLSVVFWAFVHDSAGPALRDAQRTDSTTIRLTFAAKLAPPPPAAAAVRVLLLPDSTPMAVDTVFTESAWTAQQAAAPADSAALDSAAPDSAAPDSAAPAPAPIPRETGPGGRPAPDAPEAPDTLLASRPALSDVWYVRLRAPMAPGARYLIEATAANPGGAVATTRAVLVLPAPPPAPVPVPADTTGGR